MKLLGTPTDRDLQAMRATCCADDLPKLKPYPWERIFPQGTPPEAVDLAQRLLRYDPDERLTAPMVRIHTSVPLLSPLFVFSHSVPLLLHALHHNRPSPIHSSTASTN